MTHALTKLAQAHPGPIIAPRGLIESINTPLKELPQGIDFAVANLGSGDARPLGPSFIFHICGPEVHAIVWQSLVAADWTGLYHPRVHFRALRKAADRMMSASNPPAGELELVAVDDDVVFIDADYTLQLALAGSAALSVCSLLWHVEAVITWLWTEVDAMLSNREAAERLYLEVFGRKPFAEPTNGCWHGLGDDPPIVEGRTRQLTACLESN